VSDPKTSARRWLLLGAKLLVIALVVWFVRRTLVEGWSQLGDYQWGLGFAWLVLAGGLYLLALCPAAVFWFCCLRALGQQPHLGETLRAYFIGHLGKYVPGKAMVVVIRAAMIGGHRVDTGVAAASVFLETLTWVASGSFLAAAYLAVRVSHQHMAVLGAVALMALAGLPTLPPVFARLARLAGVGRSDPQTVAKLHRLGFRTILLGWMIMPLGWAFMGLAYWATLRGIGLAQLDAIAELPRYTAAIALATVAGFAAIFLPAGVGVREAALVELTIPYLRGFAPQAELVAWVSAVLIRLVSVVSELVISGILYLIGLPRRNEPLASPPAPQNG